MVCKWPIHSFLKISISTASSASSSASTIVSVSAISLFATSSIVATRSITLLFASISACCISRLTSTSGELPSCTCVINCDNASGTCISNSNSCSLAVTVLSITRLSKSSILHENSPTSIAPAMRPLPFRVCILRRTVPSVSSLSG